MQDGRDDDLAVGEALIEELTGLEDPVAQRETVDRLRDCEKRLRDQTRFADGLRLLDSLLDWQLRRESEYDPSDSLDNEIAYTMLSRTGRLRTLDRSARQRLKPNSWSAGTRPT